MSKADKMFEKLGYEKAEIDVFIQFNKIKERISITFNTKEKTVSKTKGYNDLVPITCEERQAINEKAKEFRLVKQLNKEIKSIKENI